MDEAQRNSRIAYPKLSATLTEEDLRVLFAIQSDERTWAITVARPGLSRVGLLIHLKVFQHVGRFLPISDLPTAAIAHVARQCYLDEPADFGYDRRTLYRHHRAIREYLGITPWGAKARGIAATAIATAAEARLDPADLINAAVDALIRERCELPLLTTLETLAGTAHRAINAAQWHQVYECLSGQDIKDLEVLLTVDENSQESPFARMCRGAGKPTRENLKGFIAHYRWLEMLVDPAPPLAPIAAARVAQRANEAQRLKARELREYVAHGAMRCCSRHCRQPEAIKSGAIHVTGSVSYDDFWGRLPAETRDPTRRAAYAAERGWPADGAGFVDHVRQGLVDAAEQLDREVSLFRRVRLDATHGRPVLGRIARVELPDTAIEAARQVIEEMPERSVLEALSNTAQWVDWPRHFGLPSQLGSAIENVRDRYLITTFAYGCGLGATQAARHFGGTVSAEDLSFVDRRHVDIANLRAGSADLQNLYAQFELTRLWGTGEAAAADGTHFETFRNNLLAAYHFRYGKTGGIAYRHISDNYIALFSRFIGCGLYEATYILDILLHSVKALRPTRRHADTHGQSAHVFGLAYLLGIELLPRIRSWKKLKLYHPGIAGQFESIEHLLSAAINSRRIERHYPDFIQLALAIHSGQLAPSAVLARINSHSSRDSFSLALQDLGNAVRTTFLLRWSADEQLRRDVHKGTTKVERSHHFAKYLNFGGEGGMLRTNNPADQEKAIVYNELVANAVAVQTVADQTDALHKLKRRGIHITAEDLSYFSPYPTSKVKRFGDYPAHIRTDARAPNRRLPQGPASAPL